MHSQTLSNGVANLGARHAFPALSAMAIGLLLVLIAGFAPVPELHNAAHDTRHSASFPCH